MEKVQPKLLAFLRLATLGCSGKVSQPRVRFEDAAGTIAKLNYGLINEATTWYKVLWLLADFDLNCS